MKDVFLILLCIAVSMTTVVSIGVQLAKADLEAQLEVAKAIAATGPCGDGFLVVLQKGENQGKVAVAGRVVSADEAGKHFLAKGPDGVEEVYASIDQGKDAQLIFRRVPPTGCPAAR